MERHFPHFVIINASLNGAEGNTARLLEVLAGHLRPSAEISTVVLSARPDRAGLWETMRGCQGLVLGTGTHWDSWSSLCQEFLEESTPFEGTSVWLGKPVAVVVTEHSVGGKGVLSRLQGVLATLGCLIPPMSGLVYSRAVQEAAGVAEESGADYWGIDDLAIIAANLKLAAQLSPAPPWQSWPVDRSDLSQRWARPQAGSRPAQLDQAGRAEP